MSRLARLVRRTSPRPAGSGISRRDLVRFGFAAAATAGFEKCRVEVFGGRTIVIGAGLAGLHCAWRLVEGGLDVQVYEASDRIGGRQFTGRGLFANDLICEFGGEFIDTNHLAMHELATEFGIVLDDRLAFEVAGMAHDTWFIDGQIIPEADIVAQFTAVAPTIEAAFTAAETSKADFQLLSRTTLAQFLLDTVPPATYPELHAVLTAAYRGEYGLECELQSCLNFVFLIDSFTPDPFRIYGESDERYHAHDGSDVFSTSLANAIGLDKITMSAPLVAVRDLWPVGYEVELSDGLGGTFTDQADHVVFALPFTKLREVDLDDVDALTPRKRRIIDELGMGTNAKVIGGFTRRPWFEDHNAVGSVTSDLPFQQVWDSTPGQTGAGGVLCDYLGGDQGVASGTGTAVEWMTAILPDLDLVYPGTAAAFDGTAERMHWPTNEWSLGAYTCYLPGQWAFFGQEGRRNGNLHFCGEHTSLDFQGWMEGAAETGALVAAEILDDHGQAFSPFLARIAAAKTLQPQACYHGDLLPDDLQPLARRRAFRELVRSLR